MSVERTLSIIKPDGVKNKITGKIISMFEENNFDIIIQKKIKLTISQAKDFYSEHSHRPFFNSLIEFMTEGACIVQVLKKRKCYFR